MSIILQVILFLFAFFFSLFFYWKALRDDYVHDKIFISGFTLLGAGILGSYIFQLLMIYFPSNSIFNNSGLWFWGGILGFTLGFLINQYRFKFRVFEAFEASVVTVLFFFAIVAQNLVIVVFMALLLILYFYLQRNYRKFSWYKSGKLGFSSTVTLGVGFVGRAIVPFIPNSNSFSNYFIGKIDGVFSLAVAVSLFFVVYNLARYR